MKKKIVYFTFHNWESKRQGGFHKFAEYSVKNGYETIFFSYPRNFWAFFKNSETFNYKTIIKQIRGIDFRYKNSTLSNKTIISLGLPIPVRFVHYFPSRLINFFESITMPSFKRYAKLNFSDTHYFVFESTSSVLLLDTIKDLFPKSKIIYRPSDPLVAFKYGRRLKKFEFNMLAKADIVFLVNQKGYNLYKKQFPCFDEKVNFKILSNGVDVKLYQKQYPKPLELKVPNTALYVGARPIDWNMILESAKLANHINFIIVCPLSIPFSFRKKYQLLKNLFYIKGIDRELVPNWVTNADVIIIPNPKNWYKSRPWGVTAKYYQAIAAKKPIISYHDIDELEKLNISVTYDTKSFVNQLSKAIKNKTTNYCINLKEKDWNRISKTFHDEIESL